MWAGYAEMFLLHEQPSLPPVTGDIRAQSLECMQALHSDRVTATVWRKSDVS